jgi:serine phosphatase RsbU (regulator of sigma subunit)
LSLSANDLLLAYSDGVSEAQSGQDEFFEVEGIEQVVGENQALPAEALADMICESAERFELGNLRSRDDKTAVAVRAIENPNPGRS